MISIGFQPEFEQNSGNPVSKAMRMKSQRPLAKGQIWNTGAAEIEIMGLGKAHIHYKVTKRVGLKHVSVQISGIEALESYLAANAARLIKGPSKN